MECSEALTKTAIVSLIKREERGWNYSIDLITLVSIQVHTNVAISTFNIWIYTPITTYLFLPLSSDILLMDISLLLFTWVIALASAALAACRAAPDSGRFHHPLSRSAQCETATPLRESQRCESWPKTEAQAALSTSLMMCSRTQADARAAAREAPKNRIILWLSDSHGSLWRVGGGGRPLCKIMVVFILIRIISWGGGFFSFFFFLR